MPDLGQSETSPHDCLDASGVIVCGKTEPHHDFPWMDRPVTQEEIDAVPEDYDLRECRVCHRRFTKRCNFDLDFA